MGLLDGQITSVCVERTKILNWTEAEGRRSVNQLLGTFSQHFRKLVYVRIRVLISESAACASRVELPQATGDDRKQQR